MANIGYLVGLGLAVVGLAVAIWPPADSWGKILAIPLYIAAAVVFGWTLFGVVRHWLRERRKKREQEKAEEERKKPKPPMPRDANRSYGGKPKYNVIREGKKRNLKATLHDIGDGWIWGIKCEIASPTGQKWGREWPWGSVTAPEARRQIADEGFLVSAEETGLYTVTWWNQPPAQHYAPEVIVSEQFPVPAEDRTIVVPSISDSMQVGSPTVTQGPRPGWSATCEAVGAWSAFGRGVVLAVESADEKASGIWCRVSNEHGAWDSTGAVFENAVEETTQHEKHFPGEFNPKPPSPLPAGEYRAEWLGDLGDVTETQEVFLAGTTFKINEKGQFYCSAVNAS